MKIKQTAGRKSLGEFAPKFAALNDDVLFGEVWSGDELPLKTRSIVTVVALTAQGITDSSLKYHLESAKNNGVSKSEIAEILTHAAFYMGWPKAWEAFNMAKEVWTEKSSFDSAKQKHAQKMIFPIGEPNTAFGKYFIGNSYLYPVSKEQVGIFNVTFEPSCRNNWHIHKSVEGGGQVLVCIAGEGYYQEWGKPVQKLIAGDTINIPANVKHWHGATKDSWFSHLAVEVPGVDGQTEWLEPVDDDTYNLIQYNCPLLKIYYYKKVEVIWQQQ